MYRRMMFAIETCFSGHWGEALMGQPDVLVLTAANAKESSKADVHDRDLGVYLSNAFARTFRRLIGGNNEISIYDLYRELFRTTKGSHVTIYNQQEYGSVYSEKMNEFLPE
jgi:glycosylphosphatidylinositol transamidase (GPIT) subunit GPI8